MNYLIWVIPLAIAYLYLGLGLLVVFRTGSQWDRFMQVCSKSKKRFVKGQTIFAVVVLWPLFLLIYATIYAATLLITVLENRRNG